MERHGRVEEMLSSTVRGCHDVSLCQNSATMLEAAFHEAAAKVKRGGLSVMSGGEVFPLRT